MPDFGWSEVFALLTSVGYGILSAIVPIANGETYIVASQVSGVVGPIPIAIGVALGQTTGKVLLFLGVRRGRESAWLRHRPARTMAKPPGTIRIRVRKLMSLLLQLIGNQRWGLPIVGLAAVIGFPPLYAVALLAGATTMRLHWFALLVLIGRLSRFLLVANGVSWLLLD